jgi:hypothetical protein
MKLFRVCTSWMTTILFFSGTLGTEGCSTKDTASAPIVQQSPPQSANGSTQDQAAPADQTQQTAQLPEVNLTADGLDELLAPIALYPDPVLAVMLQAAVNPQEVMDGGNWLAAGDNHNLKEAALDQASSKAGFTPVMQALLHYPTVVDLMCSQFDWTKQLGASYQADPRSVLASVQRLRAQAVDNGALKSSPQMKVNVTQDQGQQVVELKPGDTKTVYIPQYDPAQVYGTTTTTTTSGGTTTTTTTTSGSAPGNTTVNNTTNNTTVVQEKSGVSTGTAVMIGLLAFGAGIAVGSAINSNHYYYPAWGYGGVYYGPRPYYPPPYHPAYYPGWGGGYHYNRPVYVQNNIYINNRNNYYNRFNNNSNLQPNYKPRPVPYNSNPNGTLANNMGNRPANKNGVNYKPGNNPSTRPTGGGNAGNVQRPATGNTANTMQRPSTGNTANDWKGQSTYQGNKNAQNRPATTPGNANAGNMNRAGGTQPAKTPSGDRGFATQGGTRPNTGNMQSRPAAGTTPTTRPSTGNTQASRPAASTQPAARPAAGTTPTTRPSTGNTQASRPAASTQPAARPAAGTTPTARPSTGNAQNSRPAASTQPAARPATQPASRPQSNGGGAFNGASSPSGDRAASDRGRSSMGAPAKSAPKTAPATGARKR